MPAQKRKTKKTIASKKSQKGNVKRATGKKQAKIAKKSSQKVVKRSVKRASTKTVKRKTLTAKKQKKRPVRKAPISVIENTYEEIVTITTPSEHIETQIPTEPHEPVQFGLSAEEMAELAQSRLQKERRPLHEEFARLLPDDEPIVGCNDPKKCTVIVQSIRDRHNHSPYVLNLKQLAEEKVARQQQRESLRAKIRTINTNGYTAPQEMPLTKTVTDTQIQTGTHGYQNSADRRTVQHTLRPSDEEISEQFTRPRVLILPHRWYVTVLTFTAIALMVVLPIKELNRVRAVMDSRSEIVSASQRAYADLQIAARSFGNESDETVERLEAARLNFTDAQAELTAISTTLSGVVTLVPRGEKYLSDAMALTQAGITISELGQTLTRVIDAFHQENDLTLTQKLLTTRDELTTIKPRIQTMTETLTPINPNILPMAVRPEFIKAQSMLLDFNTGINELITFSETMADILGHHYKKRYLFIFQNNTELRATGGFMGSMALVDFLDGEIVNMEVPGGGTYDLQGYQKRLVKAPAPLQLINGRWEMHDTNWFFDFPTSAKLAADFYESAGGPSVDGVIAINATIMEQLLQHTGPIDMPDYNKVITAENFLLETQKAVEIEYDKETNRPKQFIADLMPELLSRLFDSERTDTLGVAGVFYDALAQKNIQLFFRNPEFQNLMSRYDWNGAMKQTSKNYLAVVNTNIGGGKTDNVIKQHIHHVSEIQPDGSIIDTLTITREHTGTRGDLFTGVRNVNYLRLYVPQGSQLIATNGFRQPNLSYFDPIEDYYRDDATLESIERNRRVDGESDTVIHEEFDKTVFGNWVMTDPGEKSTIVVSYKLPYRIEQPETTGWHKFLKTEKNTLFYSVFYQKQSGSTATITSEIKVPKSLYIQWHYPESLESTPHTLKRTFDFTTDSLSGIIIEHR